MQKRFHWNRICTCFNLILNKKCHSIFRYLLVHTTQINVLIIKCYKYRGCLQNIINNWIIIIPTHTIVIAFAIATATPQYSIVHIIDSHFKYTQSDIVDKMKNKIILYMENGFSFEYFSVRQCIEE